MELNLKLNDNVSVTLGELKEELMFNLDNEKIKYKIPFDKINKNGIKETIIQLPDVDVEVSIENDVVTYIKAKCNKYNKIGELRIGEVANVNEVEKIKKKIMELYDIHKDKMFIEKINLRAMELILVIKLDEKTKGRIHIMSNTQGEIFIYNLRYAA